jgi:hypothetical protein
MHERHDDVGLVEGIRTEHIALVEPIGGDDCIVLASCSRSEEARRTGDAQVGLPSAVHDARLVVQRNSRTRRCGRAGPGDGDGGAALRARDD